MSFIRHRRPSCCHWKFEIDIPPPLIRRKNSNRVEYNVHFSSYVGTFSIFPFILGKKERATDHQISSSKRFIFLFNFQKTHFFVYKWFYLLFRLHKWLCSLIPFYIIIIGWQKNSLIFSFLISDYNHFFIEISEKNHLFYCPGVSYPAGCVSLASWILTKLAA